MAHPAPDRKGFTMVELLVALVISGILASVMFQVMSGQGRFVQAQSAREEIQQNSRVALELIGSELRTVPDTAGLALAAEEEITLRVPRLWGVICAANAGSYAVTFPRVAGASFAVNAGTFLGGQIAGAATSGARVNTIGAATATCDGRPISTFEGRTITVASTPQTPTGATPQPGDAAYLYDLVTYRTGTSSGIDGTWIMRRLGDASASAQPLAGPIASGAGGEPRGLRFRYFSDAAATPLPMPLSAADRARVRRVMMIVRTESRTQNAATRQWQEDTVMISLRNVVRP